ncbi:hypothetical protein KP79_PYT22848 [Mizuhopecten yessoensis]|uniref:Uncharacterized protein n=1 Tax=Mizuhopecten yessoensis TaxID=6573 RepID=A0A210QGF3_MIZYE|nr:hypothetical protein KP79_PYT22848 [Mizuhopecten yessoensis]
MEWICKQFGHTNSVHKELYRQMSGVVEQLYVRKLLLVQDMNWTSRLKGQNLNDIDLKGYCLSFFVSPATFESLNESIHMYILAPVS